MKRLEALKQLITPAAKRQSMLRAERARMRGRDGSEVLTDAPTFIPQWSRHGHSYRFKKWKVLRNPCIAPCLQVSKRLQGHVAGIFFSFLAELAITLWISIVRTMLVSGILEARTWCRLGWVISKKKKRGNLNQFGQIWSWKLVT